MMQIGLLALVERSKRYFSCSNFPSYIGSRMAYSIAETDPLPHENFSLEPEWPSAILPSVFGGLGGLSVIGVSEKKQALGAGA